jgi:hypothetical protein
MDFSQLVTKTKKVLPVDPIKLFESLPSLDGTPNDLWRGQAEALIKWHKLREKRDVLISLNTGAGKTIVGLLVAQSLVNEGVRNVIYVCSTIDLVKQTASEATRIGIPCTVRVEGRFNNDGFETEKTFCITTYQALFNGHSALAKKHFPEAVLFDDAHVAEGILRESFTIRIDIKDYPELFDEISQLFKPYFKALGIENKFTDSLNSDRKSTTFVVPRDLYSCEARLLQLFKKYDVSSDRNLTYAFESIKDHIDGCAAIFTNGVFELAPPFIPSLALGVFEKKIRRVYLSATLQSTTEFVRAFGREPSDIIAPANDAGNGERLIIYGNNTLNFSQEYVQKLINSKKVIIAVPTYAEAAKWVEVASPPSKASFSDELNDFRKEVNGAFVLVSRVDGIDLPSDTCRIMVMDGIPSGSSLIERYQWEFLNMRNVHSDRVANRLAQLFGRINRGRNDYGVFLIKSEELNKWLATDRNVALLPPLLQKQVVLGRTVQDNMPINTNDKVSEAIDSVFSRDKGWLNYYENEIKLEALDQKQIDRLRDAEPSMIEAVIAESKYAAAMWNKDYATARLMLATSIEKVANADTPLGGWHSIWLAAAFDRENDTKSADYYYGIARARIGSNISLPRATNREMGAGNNIHNPFAEQLIGFLSHTSETKCITRIDKLKNELNDFNSLSSNQSESYVRKLGEILGFNSSRPDNDQGIGPDVLWVDDKKKLVLGLELKTNKDSSSENSLVTYTKDDIGQGHNHLTWIKDNYYDYECLGLLYVGPNGYISPKSSPSENMGLCTSEQIIVLRDQIIAIMDDFMQRSPADRIKIIEEESCYERWELINLYRWLQGKK